MHKVINKRKAPREPVRCPVRYFGDGFLGEGTVWDLSSAGWRVSGNHPAEVGSHLCLYICLPDKASETWLCVDKAVVRWASGPHFGVEIVSIETPNQKRIQRFLDSLFEG